MSELIIAHDTLLRILQADKILFAQVSAVSSAKDAEKQQILMQIISSV